MIKFVYEMAFVQFDIKMMRYAGSRSNLRSKYFWSPDCSAALASLDRIGLRELAIDLRDRCEEKSFGWSDDRVPWYGVEIYWKLLVDGLAFSVFLELIRLRLSRKLELLFSKSDGVELSWPTNEFVVPFLYSSLTGVLILRWRSVV